MPTADLLAAMILVPYRLYHHFVFEHGRLQLERLLLLPVDTDFVIASPDQVAHIVPIEARAQRRTKRRA